MLSRLSTTIVVAALAAGSAGPTALNAQQESSGEGAGAVAVGTVAVEQENFRAAPQGTVLAELSQGTPLSLAGQRGQWRQASLDAWIWKASVRSEPADGSADNHDLVVSAASGENLRDGPGGDRIGRVRPGTRLRTVEEREQWVRVRRTGWIWTPSIEISASPSPGPDTGEGAGEGAGESPRDVADGAISEAGGPTQSAVESAVESAPPSEPRSEPQPAAESAPGSSPQPGAQQPAGEQGQQRFATAGPRGLTVLAAPAGDSLAQVRPGGTFEVLDRDGEWSRVRVEGWVRTSILAAPDSLQGGVLRDIALVELQADPDGGRGRLVEWTLQFIALQHADRFRSEFAEGEAFILARGPGEEASFVYVAVPPDREAEVRKLTPLQRVRVLGRVRTARSRLTDAPIIDLLEFTPLR